MPSRDQITELAFRTLEEALAEANHGPVERDVGHRLALAWIAHIGAGLDWQYAAFWRDMADPQPAAYTPEQATYIRTTSLIGFLGYWYRSVGWEPPCQVQRGKLIKSIKRCSLAQTNK